MMRPHYCPSCGAEMMAAVVPNAVAHHACPRLGGLTVPLAVVGQAVRHVVVEREDYVGGSQGVAMLDGAAVSAVRVERPDGSNDVTIFAPTAVGRGAAPNQGG